MWAAAALVVLAPLAASEEERTCAASATWQVEMSGGAVEELRLSSLADDEATAWRVVRDHGLWAGGGCADAPCVVASVVGAMREARTSLTRTIAALRRREELLKIWIASTSIENSESVALQVRGSVDAGHVAGLRALGARVELSTESGPVATIPVRDALALSVTAVGANPGHRVVKARLVPNPECAHLFAHTATETRWFAQDPATRLYWSSATNYTTAGVLGYDVPVSIGRGSYGVEGVELWGYGTPASFRVGHFSSLGPKCVVILGGDHRWDWMTTFPFPAFHPKAKALVDSGHTDGPHATSKGDVVLGSDVWLGYGVTILSGVRVGHGAVVGARSLVAKDVPPYAVVAGTPARILRFRFDNDTIARMLRLQWWHWPDDVLTDRLPHLLRRPPESIEDQPPAWWPPPEVPPEAG